MATGDRRTRCACGPIWLPNSLVAWYFKTDPTDKCYFHEACRKHDKNFAEGKGLVYSNRIFIYDMMAKISKDKNLSSDERLSKIDLAVKKWKFVWAYGSISYFAAAARRQFKRK